MGHVNITGQYMINGVPLQTGNTTVYQEGNLTGTWSALNFRHGYNTSIGMVGSSIAGALDLWYDNTGEATSTPAHVTRARWATNCFQSPDMTAQQVQPGVVMDGAVQEQGAEISDSALQGAVAITVNKIM